MIKTKPATLFVLLFGVSAVLIGFVLAPTLMHYTQAQSIEEDPVFFVIGEGANYVGDKGWTAGYVIIGQSGTYILKISANGPENRFPVTNVKVIVCVSDEAAQKATVTIADSQPITTYTHTNPPSPPEYFGAQGGVFAESDYYGYNDDYIIPQLTYEQAHHPTSYYPLQVTVTFAPDATEDSKVMFLCYGVDSKGDPAKTPFSEGTMFVVDEYILPSAVCACFAAFAVYKKQSKTKK